MTESFGGAGQLSPEQIERINQAYRAGAQLAHYPPNYTFSNATGDFAATISAYYDSGAKEIVIVTDSRPTDRTQAYLTLVHELVHAQQDADFDLSRYLATYGTTFDRALGVRAVVEGEATLYEFLAQLELEELSVDDIDWELFWGRWKTDTLQRWDETDTPAIFASRLFPYAFGGQLVFDEWRDFGRGGVEAALSPPPESTRQIMAWPQRDAPRPPWNQDGILFANAIPELPAAYTLLDWSSEGVWLVRATIHRLSSLDTEMRSAIDAVNADSLSLFYNAEADDAVAVWRLRFDTARAAAFVRARLDGVANLSAFVDNETELVIVGGGPDDLVTDQTEWISAGVAAGVLGSDFAEAHVRHGHSLPCGLTHRLAGRGLRRGAAWIGTRPSSERYR